MTGHSTSVLVLCSCFGFRPSISSPQKGSQQLLVFRPCLLWPNGPHLSYCWALVWISQRTVATFYRWGGQLSSV